MKKKKVAVSGFDYVMLREKVLNFHEPMGAFEALLLAMGFQDAGRQLNAPNFLLTILSAFETAYREVLGVDYLYIVRSPEDDPICRLRDTAAQSDKVPITCWPADQELQDGLLLLLVTGFVYDFPLARRYCHTDSDARKRQTRIAGWGTAYFTDRLATRSPFRELYQFAEAAFRQDLRPIATFVKKDARIVERPRLTGVVEWVAP